MDSISRTSLIRRPARAKVAATRRLRFEPLERRLLLHGGVTGVAPYNGQVTGDLAAGIVARFDFDLDPDTVRPDTFQLRHPTGLVVPASVEYDAGTRTATLTPSTPLAPVGDFYHATIRGGNDGVRELGTGDPLDEDFDWYFITQPPDYRQEVVFQGLEQPTAIEFSADGRVFVAEKGGVIKVYDNLTDPTPTTVADLRENVFSFWDRGLLGMALHPEFPAAPYLYVLYAFDFDPAHPADFPRWGDATSFDDSCPDPPGANTLGCVVTGRLSRLTVGANNLWDGVEHVLVEDWGQQFPSHSLGSLAFGADGALFASAGDGASFSFMDYGQVGNPLGDPPVPAGGLQSPPTAEGGALRAQDLLTPDDPLTLSGTIIRIDPLTGQGLPDNPLHAASDPNARRIVAHGLRNPFRITVRPGTNEVWLGDVGWGEWDEINVVPAVNDNRVANFGWPAYEGVGRQGAYDGADFTLLERLYNDPDPDAHREPFFAYRHGVAVVPGDAAPAGGSSISGLAFAEGGNFPPAYDSALFFADFSRRKVWVMFRGVDGQPDPQSTAVVLADAENPTELKVGPQGDLYYVDLLGGAVRRLRFSGVDKPPVAIANANQTYGRIPLQVRFDASASFDANPGDTLTYAWDLDGDGLLDDSTAIKPLATYPKSGIRTVTLRVTDNTGLFSEATLEIQAGNTPPQAIIDLPIANQDWQVGDPITLAGRGTDTQNGNLTAAALHWDVIQHHCPDLCHTHPVTSFSGVASATFNAPDHEFPSYLEVRLTATDSWGLSSSVSRLLHPRTIELTAATNPPGLQLSLGRETAVAPFTRPVIVGSNNSLTAPSPQLLDDTPYRFVSWSDGGARSHNILAGNSSSTYLAEYLAIAPTYLSDLPFAGEPLNGWGPPERDQANGEQGLGDGGPLTLDGLPYAKGLGVHARSELVFDLNGNFARFVSDIGIDDAKGDGGAVTFEVWTDGNRIYDSGVVRGNWPTQRVDVSVAGANQLKLVVTDGGDDLDSDHGNWAGARLLARDEAEPPAMVNNTGLLVNQGGRAVLTSSELRYVDNVQPAANVTYIVRQPPQSGRLERRATPGVAINSFTQAEINAGVLSYVHAAEQGEPDRFEFDVHDGQGNVLDNQSVSIEVLQLTYLSDLAYAAPPTNGWGPVERDQSNGESGSGDGLPLTIGGVQYAKGLGVHAHSEVAFQLGGNFLRFQADVGVDDEVGPNGSVVFQVWGDGLQLFQSGLLTGFDAAERIDVSVAGVNQLVLRVTDGGDGAGFDHADWGDARLIPLPDTQPPVVTNNRGASVATGDRVLLVRDDLLYEDEVQPTSNVVYLLTAPLLHGHLELVGAAGLAIDQFTQQQINQGRLLYVHDGGSALADALVFDVHDSRSNVLPGQLFEIQAGAVQWLSDLPWETPAVNGWGPVERDLSNGELAAEDGRPISLNGLTYAKGLGVHAESVITLELASGYHRFLADVGVDDEITAGGTVVFQVWLDGIQAFDSGLLTVDSVTRRVDLDVSGVVSLQLVVTDGGDGPGWDHGDWAAARLLPVVAPASGDLESGNLESGEGEASRQQGNWADAEPSVKATATSRFDEADRFAGGTVLSALVEMPGLIAASMPRENPGDARSPEKLAPEKLAPEKLAPEKLAPEKLAPEKLAPRIGLSISPRLASDTPRLESQMMRSRAAGRAAREAWFALLGEVGQVMADELKAIVRGSHLP